MTVLGGVFNANGNQGVVGRKFEQAIPKSPLKGSAYLVYENWNLSLVTGGSDSRA